MSDARAAATRIRKALLTIQTSYPKTLQPVRRATGSHATAAAFPSLPISATILDIRAVTRNRLATECLYVIAGRDLHTENLSGGDVPAMTDLHMRHSEWMGEQASAPIAVANLEASASELCGIASTHPRDFMSLGACPLQVDVEGELTPCTGTVRAYPGHDPKCDACGVDAITSWWETMMFTDPQVTRLLTCPDLVLFIHKQFGRVVTEVAIRQWVSRGIITKAGTDVDGRTLYDRGAVAYSLERRRILA